MKNEEKVYCETPTPGKSGTNIPKWKYVLLRDTIITLLKKAGPGGIAFKELPDQIRSTLRQEDLDKLGSVMWHTTSVKLDMEVKGDIRRIDGKGPQRIVLG